VSEAEQHLIIVRYGEIGLKGKNQPRFVRQLRENVSECLERSGLPASVSQTGRRLYVVTPEVEAATDALAHVFGVVSLSPGVRVPLDLALIKSACLAVLLRAGLSADKSFRVDARRAFKGFPLTSPQINRNVGAFIQEKIGARVDLSAEADFTVGVEIHQDHALVYGQVVPGAGGLPIPLSGRAVVLMSSGLDSPVAAWLMMKRGCAVIPLHVAQSEEGEGRFRAVCDVLQNWSHGWQLRPIVVSHEEIFGEALHRLRVARGERWTCIFCKRAMVAAALAVAREHGAEAVVLGDSIGQVASQTLENMRAISYGWDMPIHRPLLGFDKVEVFELARRIGTYEISAQSSTPCPYWPRSPITRASLPKFLSLLSFVEQSGQEAGGVLADPVEPRCS